MLVFYVFMSEKCFFNHQCFFLILRSLVTASYVSLLIHAWEKCWVGDCWWETHCVRSQPNTQGNQHEHTVLTQQVRTQTNNQQGANMHRVTYAGWVPSCSQRQNTVRNESIIYSLFNHQIVRGNPTPQWYRHQSDQRFKCTMYYKKANTTMTQNTFIFTLNILIFMYKCVHANTNRSNIQSTDSPQNSSTWRTLPWILVCTLQPRHRPARSQYTGSSLLSPSHIQSCKHTQCHNCGMCKKKKNMEMHIQTPKCICHKNAYTKTSRKCSSTSPCWQMQSRLCNKNGPKPVLKPQ